MTDFITLTDLKAHLNITTEIDDELLGDKIKAASEYIAAWIAPLTEDDPVPEVLKEATRKLAADFYEHRESSANEPSIPTEFEVFALIMPYRDWNF